MPRPQGVQSDNFVDASAVLAGAPSGIVIERSFEVEAMPRLREAGAGEGSAVKVRFHLRRFDAHVAVDGALDGVARLICQRCMKAVDVPLHDTFQLLLVADEAELEEEVAGYEPIVADPSRLDLQMLAEDQALLALPLVPRHEAENCSDELAARHSAAGAASADEEVRQKPFSHLRDLLRDH